MNEDGRFDFIVVGAGSAGCVVANRLSADPRTRVCLVEAGPSRRRGLERMLTSIPVGNASLVQSAKTNWRNQLNGPAGRPIAAPRGKIDGGSSALNGMIYMRGNPRDYDQWAALGCTDWAWSDVLPFFKRHENFGEGASARHGIGGELSVEPPRYINPLTGAFLAAARQCQIRPNPDFNSEDQAGVGLHHVTQRRGVRWSSAHAFLDPVRSRPNLRVLNGWQVARVVLDRRRAIGVDLVRDGVRKTLLAGREVILSAGAIHTPQILQLSGMGPPAVLRAAGITPEVGLAVGENLQDHVSAQVAFEERGARSHALTFRSAPRMAFAVAQYLVARRGPMASNVVEAGVFYAAEEPADWPNLQLIFSPALKDPARVIPTRHGFVVIAVLLRPDSRGSVRITGPDPAAPPRIDAGLLEASGDLATLRRGLHLAQKIALAPALDAHRGRPLRPAATDWRDDESLDAYIRGTCGTVFHPVGTCAMGRAGDPAAVVDARLRVQGVDGLRVADASIMPRIVSGNTNAPAMMIGERCAQFILQS